jgi:hypothetical protein
MKRRVSGKWKVDSKKSIAVAVGRELLCDILQYKSSCSFEAFLSEI